VQSFKQLEHGGGELLQCAATPAHHVLTVARLQVYMHIMADTLGSLGIPTLSFKASNFKHFNPVELVHSFPNSSACFHKDAPAGVIISTVLIRTYGWTWTDAFMSIIIAVLIFVRFALDFVLSRLVCVEF